MIGINSGLDIDYFQIASASIAWSYWSKFCIEFAVKVKLARFVKHTCMFTHRVSKVSNVLR